MDTINTLGAIFSPRAAGVRAETPAQNVPASMSELASIRVNHMMLMSREQIFTRRNGRIKGVESDSHVALFSFSSRLTSVGIEGPGFRNDQHQS